MTAPFESLLKAQALGLGFDRAGIAALGPAETHGAFRDWLAAGHHGEMAYLERGADLRADSRLPEPGMRSALVVLLDYGGKEPAGPVARYARGDDYHRVMWDRLDTLLAWAQQAYGAPLRGRAYVDTGPILERELARRAGLGWVGKNTMLLHPELGSFFFIGALFLDAPLAADAPFDTEHCGTCTRCLEACPTDAFPAPMVLDATRCLSYHTIESRAEIPAEFQPELATRVFGCDTCQDVCPWNVKFARVLDDEALAPREFVAGKDARRIAEDLLALDDAGYREALKGSAMRRAKLAGLQRNARASLAAQRAD